MELIQQNTYTIYRNMGTSALPEMYAQSLRAQPKD